MNLPPHSIEAEQGVLGCVLLSPNVCLEQCLEKFQNGSEVFYDLRHRTVYETLVEMYDSNKAIDLITVQQVLNDKQQLEGVGGLAYLASLPDAVPSSANLDYYLEIVRDKYALRRIIGTCTEVVTRASNHRGEVDGLIDEVEQDLLNACRRDSENNQVGSPAASRLFVEDMDARVSRHGPTGLITGFLDLDRMTDGLQFGEQFIIGARPSIGKTAIGLNIFMRASLLNNIKSVFISLEQSCQALMRRLASAYTHVNMKHIRNGNLREEEQKLLCEFAVKYKSSPATIYDFVSSGASSSMIASIVRRESRNGVRLVVIDYLQKIKPVGRHEKRTYEVGDISGALRAAANSSGVAMVTLCQLNREPEKEKGRPPRLTDLADSGQIERDADAVGLLHRDRSIGFGPATLCLAKQRDGETGIVNLYFNGNHCEFSNGQRGTVEDEL